MDADPVVAFKAVSSLTENTKLVINLRLSESGGTGRRTGLRIQRTCVHGGSTPPSRTIKKLMSAKYSLYLLQKIIQDI